MEQTFPDLDAKVQLLFRNAEDIKMWRLYKHDEYPYWVQGRSALLGDAAHPMVSIQQAGGISGYPLIYPKRRCLIKARELAWLWRM